MSNEEEAKLEAMKRESKRLRLDELTPEEFVEKLRKEEDELERLEAELKALEAEEDSVEWNEDEEYENVERVEQDNSELSIEELEQKVAFIEEQIEQAKQRVETNRRGVKLGYLKLANQARRCTHLKNNGEQCRAPAMGDRLFCVFHSRAYDCETNQRVKVGFLEDRASLQLLLKQIMEQVVTGRMQPQTATLLLRATQIANGVLKKRKSPQQQRKPVRSATQHSRRNPEEIAG